MFSRSSGPVSRQVLVALCLMTMTMLVAVICASTADAAIYKMLLCAGNNGSNGYEVRTNSPGLFNVENYCGPAPDPAGNSAFLRIYENQGGGGTANTAYGQISWTAAPWTKILAGGGYTREQGAFNDGWRGRFWAEGTDGSTPHNILMQGTGAENSGISWSPTSTFASHLWPFPGFGDYKRFAFELTCMRPAGCDLSGWNVVEANTIVLTLSDEWTPVVHLTEADPPMMSGAWVRGTRTASMNWSELGSGIRMERFRIDGVDRWAIDHRAAGECNIDYSQERGEFARDFQPCAVASDIGRGFSFDSATLADGAHTLQACVQDYAQNVGLYGTGGESCDQRTIRTDNNPPSAPAGLTVTSANPARYLPHFGARFALPADAGSPIVGFRYFITDASQAGKVVAPEHFVAGSEPALEGIDGPDQPGAYTLHVALQDQVGFVGPYAAAPVPHDTTPPAAPQALRVSGPSMTRKVPRFDLVWENVVDAGAPVAAAHYQVIDSAGNVIVATRTLAGSSPEALTGIETPAGREEHRVRLWLSDAEGNVGAPVTVAVPRDTTPPAAPQDLWVAAPGTSRAEQGFDVRWRDIADAGSPVDAAHYEILTADGRVVVGPRTVAGEGIESIIDLDAPGGRGTYTLKLWLSDAEGNVGAPATAPLAYECVRSEVGGGRALSAGLGEQGASSALVSEGSAPALAGELRGSGDLSGASICVFGRVVTEGKREFLGLAMTGKGGAYRFGLESGPSRELTAVYRGGQREVSSSATVRTQVRPTLYLGTKVVHGKGFATFYGSLPAPENDGVMVVLQVGDSEDHWRAFRRYLTQGGGRFSLRYRFKRPDRPITYVVRAQMRGDGSYPYEPGNSRMVRLRVVP